ncbi:MAG TPA: YggS family pyridoxal phosphate-dependent enzyme [Pseudonocardiaceae bacterium]|nr:YggS family pyridoxal phosphate-dependent enzyme [Pseudonocardiaceae bacterium]
MTERDVAGRGTAAGRRDELGAALAQVRSRIRAACSAADRDPAEVRLLAVTKTFPAYDVALLAELGLLDVAEARNQEAVTKVAQVHALRPRVAPRWHMIGRLQRNKARSVARWAVQVQSVDSVRLVDALDRAIRQVAERDGPLGVLVQASLDGDPARGGCPLPLLGTLADRVAAAPGLRLEGVMGVAPLGADPAAAFAELAAAAQRLRQQHPAAVELSAGMSADLESAIAHGSTCVRVGTALLGSRPLTSP